MPVFTSLKEICACGVLGALIVSLSWCQPPPASLNQSDRGYDIEITRRISNSCDAGELGLTADNFIVTQGSRRFDVRVSQPVKGGGRGYWNLGKHLLIVFPVGSVQPTQAELLKGLKMAMAAGWSVMASRLDGSFTPYETSLPIMKEELEVGAEAIPSQTTGLASIEAATGQLSWFTGRRALIIQAPEQRNQLLTNWFYRQVNVFSMLYLIDGGVEVEYTGADFGMGAGLADATFRKRRRVYGDGIYHEVNFVDAVRDLIGDSHCDYDIQFWLPASDQQSAASIQLTLRHATDLRSIRTDMYFVGDGGRTHDSSSGRTPALQKLVIGQK